MTIIEKGKCFRYVAIEFLKNVKQKQLGIHVNVSTAAISQVFTYFKNNLVSMYSKGI